MKYLRYKRICHQQWPRLSFGPYGLAAGSGWPLPLSHILTRGSKKRSQNNINKRGNMENIENPYIQN